MFIKTQEYVAWKNMRMNCRNKGLEISPELNTFAGFLDVIGHSPAPGVRLIRKDTNGGLVQGNIDWYRPQLRDDTYYGAQKAWERMHAKCRAAGCRISPAFDRFASFISIVGLRPSSDHRLTRKRPQLGMTEGNVVWAKIGESPWQKEKYGLSHDEHARITAIAKACKIGQTVMFKMLILGLTTKEILFEQEHQILNAANQYNTESNQPKEPACPHN